MSQWSEQLWTNLQLEEWNQAFKDGIKPGWDTVGKYKEGMEPDTHLPNGTPVVMDVSNEDGEYTGGSVDYYKVQITAPTTAGNPPYMAECNDIIEALGMNYAEGNAFKALWRMGAARNGKRKKGNSDPLYDAEKVKFFAGRLVEQCKQKN